MRISGIIILLIAVAALTLLVTYVFFLAFVKNKQVFLSRRFYKAVQSFDSKLQFGNEMSLSRIERVKNVSPTFEKLYTELDEIDFKMQDIISKFYRLANSIQYDSYSKNEAIDSSKEVILDLIKVSSVKEIETKVTKANSELKELRKMFDSKLEQYLSEENALMSEYVWYISKLTYLEKVFNSKKDILFRIEHKANDMLHRIHEKSAKFQKQIHDLNHKESSKTFDKFIELVSAYSLIVKEAPQIASYLDETIPKMSKDIINRYKTIRETNPHFLENVDINVKLREVAEFTTKAREKFENLSFLDAKDKIRSVLSIFNWLNKKIDYELQCQEFLNKHVDEAINSYELIINRFAGLSSVEDELKEKKYSIKNALQLLFNQSDKQCEKLKHSYNHFNANLTETSYSYQSKVSLLKSLLQDIESLNRTCNEIDIELYHIELNMESCKYKLEGSNEILGEMKNDIHEYNLKFDKDQLGLIEKLKEEILATNTIIMVHGISDKTQELIDKLIMKISTLASNVSTEIKFAEIVRNLIKHFNPARALSAKLNATLNEVERNYMAGEYSHCINSIITTLEEGIV